MAKENLFIDLLEYPPEPGVAHLLSEEFARRHWIVPLSTTAEELIVASPDGLEGDTLRELARLTRRKIRPVQATREAIGRALNQLFRKPQGELAPFAPLGELLVLLGYVSTSELQEGLALQAKTGEHLGRCLLTLGHISEERLAEAVALQLRVPHLRLERIHIDPAMGFLLSGQFMMEKMVVPLKVEGRTLLLATPTPQDGALLAQVEALSGLRVRPVFSCQDEVRKALTKLHYTGPKTPPLSSGAWGETAVRLGYLTAEELAGARVLAERTGESLEKALERLGFLTPSQIKECKAKALSVEFWPSLSPDKLTGLQRLIPFTICQRYQMIPLEKRDSTLLLGMVQPWDREVIDLARAITELAIRPVLVDEEDLQACLEDWAFRSSKPDLEAARRRWEWYLLHLGYLDGSGLERARKLAAQSGNGLEECLLELGLVDEVDLREAYGLQTGYPHISTEYYTGTPEMIQEILPAELMLKYTLLPLLKYGNHLVLAMADPRDGEALAAVAQTTGLEVLPVAAARGEISVTLDRFFLADILQVAEEVRKFAQQLVHQGHISQSQSILALREVAAGTGELDQILVKLGLLSEERFAALVSDYLGLPRTELDLVERVETVLDAVGQPVERHFASDPVDQKIARLLEGGQARTLGALPITEDSRQVTVAFATPLPRAKMEELRKLLGKPIRPVVALRSHLEDAIQRTLGRRTIGNYLLMAQIIDRKELENALALAERTGVRVGQALVNRGYITEEQLYSYLAEQQGLAFFDLSGTKLDPAVVRLLPEELCRRIGCLPLSMDEEEIVVAMPDPLDSAAIGELEATTARKVRPVVITEGELQAALEKTYSRDYLEQSTSELLYRMPENSAYTTLTPPQMAGIILVLVSSVIGVVLNYVLFFTIANTFMTVFYVGSSAYKVYLVYKALSHTLEVEVTPEEVAALDERKLPIYTILVPLYREAEVLPSLVEALARLDYPSTKLDVKILLEEDDRDTIEAFARLSPPAHFQRVIVPTAQPKTKPKACNYGLLHAKGEFTVIFDAEDLPDPDQLKKVQIAFAKAGPKVACIQCKLNYYNRHQNIITHWFTTEYSMWFDLFLPGLDASNAPIPLGGTSNHFRTLQLKEVGAWDPYNVTEDADLGIRLFKAGYRTAVVDSTTYEEANSELYNWVRQRSRWMKGYIQTWLVHMRHPLRLMRSIGFVPWLSFQFVVGGTFFGALVNPIYWTLTALWFLTEWHFIQQVFPAPIFYIGALGLYFGNFAFTYLNVAGCMRREYYDMVKYALISPLYWAVMSIGAWKGFIQLIYRPHFWEKTVHGLYAGRPYTQPARRLRDLF